MKSLLPILAGAVAPAVLALPVAAHAEASSPVLPGYWDSVEHYSVLLPGGGHARKCLTAAQIQSFVAAPSNSHYRCTYASQQISGGQASYRGGACFNHKTGRKVLSNVAVDGHYAPEAFHVDFRFDLLLSAGVGLPGSAEIEAHRISAECPAADPPAH